MNHSYQQYLDPRYIMSTGFAQLPKGTPLSEMQKVFACSLVFDRLEGRVVDASFTFLMDLNENFMRGLIIGRELPDEWHALQQCIRERFLVPTQGVVIQAIRASIDRYLESTREYMEKKE